MKMQIDFTGKRVLVTGGSSPIGRAAAAAYLEHGAVVAVQVPSQSLSEELSEELAHAERLTCIVGDISEVSGCRAVVDTAVEKLGGMDVLVHASGFRPDIKFEDVTPEDWDAAINGTFKAATFCTQRALGSLKQSSGNIVNVATNLGLMGGPTGSSVHSAAMGSIVNMTRMEALRLGVDGVRSNCLCHGAIEESISGWGVGAELPESALNSELKVRPIGRHGRVDDMTPAILFLSSPYAGFMTGSVIVSDGGKFSGC
jgi:NAD(P)-dependent dehydrogenase (short-subunit alcohol dehydrogenase family)